MKLALLLCVLVGGLSQAEEWKPIYTNFGNSEPKMGNFRPGRGVPMPLPCMDINMTHAAGNDTYITPLYLTAKDENALIEPTHLIRVNPHKLHTIVTFDIPMKYRKIPDQYTCTILAAVVDDTAAGTSPWSADPGWLGFNMLAPKPLGQKTDPDCTWRDQPNEIGTFGRIRRPLDFGVPRALFAYPCVDLQPADKGELLFRLNSEAGLRTNWVQRYAPLNNQNASGLFMQICEKRDPFQRPGRDMVPVPKDQHEEHDKIGTPDSSDDKWDDDDEDNWD